MKMQMNLNSDIAKSKAHVHQLHTLAWKLPLALFGQRFVQLNFLEKGKVGLGN
jgi:hypothetical protein